MAVCWVLVMLAVCAVTASALHADVLSPVKSSGVEAGLIIVPGAYIPGKAYKPLGEAIQKRSTLRLWVGLLKGFILDTPNPLQLGTAIRECRQAFQDKGMNSSNVFLAGHSLGGVFAGDYGKSHVKELSGVLLYGSYLTQGNTLHNYPLPVLTLTGDLDGLTRLTRILTPFQELNEMIAMGQRDAVYRTPVILVPGLNHAEFASGPMPTEVRYQDLAPELDNVTAYEAIANITEYFMVATLGEPAALLPAYKQELAYHFSATGDIFQPLMRMKILDQNGGNVSNWSVRAQTILAGASANFSMQLLVKNFEDLDKSKFQSDTPSLQRSGSQVTVTTVTHLEFPFNPLDISTLPSTPTQLAVKMKRREAIFPPGHSSLTNTTCKDVNQAAYELAMETASKVALTRFKDRQGRPMVMKDDVVTDQDKEWEKSTIFMEDRADGMEVTSTVLLTQLNASAPLAGMHYCTLLSPFRALEWIYVDSLKKHNGSLF